MPYSTPRPTGPQIADQQDGHFDAETSPYPSQRVIPHGPVSPDGRRAYPRPSLASKILVWGGVGITAAVATAGTVMAARKVAELISGSDDPALGRRVSRAPGYETLTEHEQDRLRTRAHQRALEEGRAEARAFAAQAERPRRPRKPRPPQKSFGTQVGDIARGINSVVAAATAASAAFRSVAAQAPAIMEEFGRAADQARSFASAFMPENTPASRQTKAKPHRHPDIHEGANRDLDQALSRKVAGVESSTSQDRFHSDSDRTHRL